MLFSRSLFTLGLLSLLAIGCNDTSTTEFAPEPYEPRLGAPAPPGTVAEGNQSAENKGATSVSAPSLRRPARK